MPEPKKKPAQNNRLKLLKRVLIAVCVVGLVVLLTFSWWSRFAAKPLIESFAGAEIESIEQPSWKRWEIRGLSLEQAAFGFQAERAEVPSPTAWLLNKLFGDANQGEVHVEEWALTLKEAPTDPDREPAPIQIPSIFDQANQAIALMRENIGPIKLIDGTIIQDGKPILSIETVKTDGAVADARLQLEMMDPALPLELSLDFTEKERWQALVKAPTLETELELEIADQQSTLKVDGRALSSGNEVQLQAAWLEDQEGVLPHTARVHTERFELDRRYDFWNQDISLALSSNIGWEDGRYEYVLQSLETGEAEDEPKIYLAGSGGLQSVTLEDASVELPWLLVESDAPLTLDFTLDNPLQDAEVQIRTDLARLPWIEGAGVLRASVRTESSEEALPIVSARISGDDLSIYDTRIENFTTRLSTLGKRIIIEELSLNTTEGSNLAASGALDLEARQLEEFSIEGTLLNESQRLNELLPLENWASASIDLTASGPFASPQIEGQLEALELKLPSLQPISVAVQAEGSLDALQTQLVASTRGDNRLVLNAETRRSENALSTTVSKLSLLRAGEPMLDLPQPAQVSFRTDTGAVEVSGLILAGSTQSRIGLSDFRLQDDVLALNLYVSEISPDLAAPWVEASFPPIRVIDLTADIRLSPEGGTVSSAGEVIWSIDGSNTIEASWRAQSPEDADSLLLDHLEVGSSGKHIVRANGALPVALSWSQRQLGTSLIFDAPMSLTLKSAPHPDFWQSLEALIPFALSQPTIDAELAGTLEKPEGRIDVRLDSVTWKGPEEGAKQVELTDLIASARADSSSLRISSFSTRLGDNTINASATVPLGEDQLEQILRTGQVPDLGKMSGQAIIEVTDLLAVDPWLPDFLRKTGGARAEVTIQPNDIRAVVDFKDLATRPLPPLGAMSDVGGRIVYDNGILKVEGIQGLAEKSRFTISGDVNLEDLKNPVYDLAFTSDEFPLVRDAGLLLTGDIDLKLVSEGGKESATPSIKGSVNLTKGLVLVEPEILASSTKTSRQRPPYFAVEAEPFNDWLLDVNIEGDEFLRVSNSFFEGTLSADFELDGSLGNPLLVGKATADSGRIFFPASSLNLVNGEARITRDRPTEIQLEADAEGRLYAYDINLSVSGTLEDLDLAITTNPALSQVEALLLVTTGTVPDTQGSLAQQSATSLGLFIGKGLFRKLTSQNRGDAASRLTLEVGNDITLQGKKTIEAAYKLTEELEIEGEYDRRDEYNANLKWTFFEK